MISLLIYFVNSILGNYKKEVSMKRRKNGEGSWGHKTIKGVTYQYYRTADGKYTYGKTTKEVKEKLEKKKDFIQNTPQDIIINNVGVINSTTFGEYVKSWLKSRNDIEITTLQSYEGALAKRFFDFKYYDLSNKQIKSLSSIMLQDYLDTLAEHYSRNTILKTWSPIKQCLLYAIQTKEISSDVLSGIKIPKEFNCKIKTKEIDVIEEKHINMLYNEAYRKYNNGKYVYGDAAKVVCLIMYTGLRLSEALGLKWDCIDFKNKKMTIKSSVAVIKKNDKYVTIDKATKRESSNRTIPLPDRAIQILRDLEKNNINHKKTDYICITSNKTLFRKRNIERVLFDMLQHLGIEENYTPHSLRHGYGSILLSNGVDIKVVSELLGHKDVTTTYNIYIKVYNKDKDKAIDIFNTL